MLALVGCARHARGRWFWPVWLSGLAVALGLTFAAASAARFPGDLAVARALQAWRWPGEDTLVRLENVLGNGAAPTAVALLSALVLLVARRVWACLALLLDTALWPVSSLLKQVARRPRPPASLIAVHEHASGYSFPSGHVFTAVMLYGGLAGALPRPRALRLAVQGCCLLVVAWMGFAPVAHWPSDVLGGYLWDALTLALLLRLLWRGPRAPRAEHPKAPPVALPPG